jgi:translation initiation factor 2A
VLPARKDDGVVRGPMSDIGKPASTASSKNAKRRQKKAINAGIGKGRDGERGGGGGGGGGGGAGGGAGGGGGNAATAPAPAPATGSGATAQDPIKKARGLQKKLRQIDQLKEKQASGTVLESNQISKIETEASIRAELEALGVET